MSNTTGAKGILLAVQRGVFLTVAVGLSLVFDGCAHHHDTASAGTSAKSASPSNIPERILQEAAAKPSAPLEGEGWRALFGGQTLEGWREINFTGQGNISCEAGLIVLNRGDPFTGIQWTNEFFTTNYEVSLDAMRLSGSDFFCGLTVPVGDSFCSLIIGGWGGSLVGISSIDGMDASENETTKFVSFEQERWYRIRLRITDGRIEGWIDHEKMVDVVTKDRRISLRPGDIELSKPFGITSWETAAALREIKMRTVSGPADPRRRSY